MNMLRSFVEASPVPADAQWGPVIAADMIGCTLVGSLSGFTAASLGLDPLLYPGEQTAISDATTQLQKANGDQAQDEQLLSGAEVAHGRHSPIADQLRAQVGADRQTVATVQHRLDALPDHGNTIALEGLGVGVALGLVAAGVKLGIRKIRTNRAA